MRLNDEQQKRALERIEGTLRAGCPACHESSWDLDPGVFEISEYPSKTFEVGSKVYPLIVLQCRACAHLMLFNAAALGLLPAKS